MDSLQTLFLLSFGSLAVLAVLLLVVDVNISQTRRIEKQVARDVRRIRIKTIKGWSAERIARRYPDLPVEQIGRVRLAMERQVEAVQEVDLLRSLWSIEIAEPDYES